MITDNIMIMPSNGQRQGCEPGCTCKQEFDRHKRLSAAEVIIKPPGGTMPSARSFMRKEGMFDGQDD